MQFQRPALGELPDARAMGAGGAAQAHQLAQARGDHAALGAGGPRRRAARRRRLLPRVERVRGDGPHAGPAAAELTRRAGADGPARLSRRRASRSRSPASRTLKPRRPERAAAGRGARHGRRLHALDGHADPGYDAVDRDRDPKPGRDPTGARTETSGTALASILAAAGERVLPIRVASLRAAGGAVEAAVDDRPAHRRPRARGRPQRRQDTSDHVPVALIGVNAPYAGFSELARGGGGQRRRRASARCRRARRQRGRRGARQRDDRLARLGAATRSRSARSPAPSPRRAPSCDADGDTLAEAAVLAGDAARGGKTAGPVDDTDPAVARRAADRASAARS